MGEPRKLAFDLDICCILGRSVFQPFSFSRGLLADSIAYRRNGAELNLKSRGEISQFKAGLVEDALEFKLGGNAFSPAVCVVVPPIGS